MSTEISNNKPDGDFSLHKSMYNLFKNLTSCFNLEKSLQTLCQSLQLSKAEKVFFISVSEQDQSEYIDNSNLKHLLEQYYNEQRFSTRCNPSDVYNQAEVGKLSSLNQQSHGCISAQGSSCEEVTAADREEECPSKATTREKCVVQTAEHPEAIHVLNSGTSPVSAAEFPPGGERARPIVDADRARPVCDATFDTKSTESVSTEGGSCFLDDSCLSEVSVDGLGTSITTSQSGNTDTDTDSPACRNAVRNKTENDTLDEQATSQRVCAENSNAVQSSGIPENKAGGTFYEAKDILLEISEEEKVFGSTHSASMVSLNETVVYLCRPVMQNTNSDLPNVTAATSDEAVITKTFFRENIPIRMQQYEGHLKVVFWAILRTEASPIPFKRTVNQDAEHSVLSRSIDDEGEHVETERFTESFGDETSKSTPDIKPWKADLRMNVRSVRKETQRCAILILEEKQTDLESATSRSDSASAVSLFVTTEKQRARSCTVSLDKDVTTQKTERCKSDFRVCAEVSYISRKIRNMLACKSDGAADWQLPKLPALAFAERLAASVVVQAYPLLLQDLVLGPRSELWRLCTFSSLIGLPVSTIRLARSGFYYAQNRDDIQCFSCGARKRHWDNSELDVDRFHFPDCTHAHSSDTTNAPIDNIAAVPHASSHERNVHVDMQHDGGERQHGSAFLQTGQAVPSRELVTASASLSDDRYNPAESGSSEVGRLSLPAPAEDPGLVARHREFAAQSAGTAVPVSSICPLSTDSGVAFSPNETVDGVNAAPSTYMKQFPTVAYVTNTTSQVPTVTGSGRDHFEYCRFPVQATQRQSSAAPTYGQPNIGTASTRLPSSLHEELSEEGRRVDAVLIQLDMTRAASRHNATARDRLASFVGWLTSSGQTPRALALAGFYYLGSGDSVRCWYCGIILRNWRPFDDPWVTHVLFRFSCGFVIAVRGQNFVTQALVGRGHEHTSLSPAEFPPSSGSTDGLHATQVAATLHDQVRSTRLPEESGSATSTLGGQREWGQTASNSPINANSRNTSSNRAVTNSVNNNDISKNGDCIQGPLAERNATSQRPSGSEADRKAIAQWIETVTASNSNVGESRSKTSDEERIATRHENPPEVPDRESGSAQNNTSTGSGKAARENASGESDRRESAQSDAQSSRGRDQGSNVGNDTSVPKGPGYQSDVGAAKETSSDAGRFAIETDGPSVAAPSRDNSPRRPDSVRGKSRGKLFGKWRKSKSKSHKKVKQQTANTAEDSSQPSRSSSQIHGGKADPGEQHSGQSTPSRGPGGTDASGKHDVKGNKKEKERKQSEAKKNTLSFAENAESSVNGQTESSTSRVQNASYGQAARLQAEISSDHVITASNERQTSSPHAENSTSDLANASYEKQTANLQTQSRASHVENVSRERRPTDQPRNHAFQMLQVDSEAHDSVQGPSWKESTLPRGPDITRGTLQRQSSTVPEPSGCRPVSEPPLLHNMEPADRDALYRRLQEENQRLRARRTCRICRRQTVDTIFLPCGHICSCETCASTVRECCLCFQRIRGTAHVYLE